MTPNRTWADQMILEIQKYFADGYMYYDKSRALIEQAIDEAYQEGCTDTIHNDPGFEKAGRTFYPRSVAVARQSPKL